MKVTSSGEPSVWIGSIVSVVALLSAFGVHISNLQEDAIRNFLIAIAGLAPLVGALWTRAHVSPVAKIVELRSRFDLLVMLAKSHGATDEDIAKIKTAVPSVPPPAPPAVVAAMLFLVVTCVLAQGCTKSAWTTGVTVLADGCKVVLVAADPGLAPLCVLAEELADLGIDVSSLPKVERAGACAERQAPVIVDDALYKKVLAARAAKGVSR